TAEPDTTPSATISTPTDHRPGPRSSAGPEPTGPFDGLQAEFARVPYAAINLVKLPDQVTDEQAIMISDIFPTAYFGAEIAEVSDGDAVAVFGCGPVGQFATASAKILGAGRIFAVDKEESRLEMARAQGAEVVNFNEEDPVEVIFNLTGGIGVDCVTEAVGVDAEHAHSRLAAEQGEQGEQMAGQFEREMSEIAPETNPQGDNWHPGGAPSQSLMWATQCVAKGGSIGVIGVFPPQAMTFPIGALQQRNLTLKGGNCNHRKYIPRLVGLVATGALDPTDRHPNQQGAHDGRYRSLQNLRPAAARLDQGGATAHDGRLTHPEPSP
ncbi:MAG: zinc-binding dehydrogenase, partial [Rubrobacteraceae bacterium]